MERKRAKIIENGDPHIPQVSTQLSLVKATPKLKYEAESVNRVIQGFRVPYTANGHNLHNIDAGDVLFDVVTKEHAAYQKSTNNGTMARARLNNVQLPDTFNYQSINTENTPVNRKIWRMFRFYGFSIKQHLVNIHDPQSIDVDDPVSMVSGTMSVRNYTRDKIEMGTALFYHFPDPNQNQYIANNLSTQKEIRESKAFELRPLAPGINLLSKEDMFRHYTVTRHYHNFLKFCIADRLFEALHGREIRGAARGPGIIAPPGVPNPNEYIPAPMTTIAGMTVAKLRIVMDEIVRRLNDAEMLFELEPLLTVINALPANSKAYALATVLAFFRKLYTRDQNHQLPRGNALAVTGLGPTRANVNAPANFAPADITTISLNSTRDLRYVMYMLHIDTPDSYNEYDLAIKNGLNAKLTSANAVQLRDARVFPTNVLIHALFSYQFIKDLDSNSIGDYNSIQVLRLPFDPQILRELQWITTAGVTPNIVRYEGFGAAETGSFPTNKGMRCVEYMDILESNLHGVGIPVDVIQTAFKMARWYIQKYPVQIDTLEADPGGLYKDYLHDTVGAELSKLVKENVNYFMSRFAGVAQQDAKPGQLFLFNATPNFRQVFQDVL